MHRGLGHAEEPTVESVMVKALPMMLLNRNHVGAIHYSDQDTQQFDLQASFGRRNDA